jgi:1,4-dihydroxy-2-naphthoyl-CoA hydrolase
MAFEYPRTIHFPETDAAGVVFFAAYLGLCHEAYEEALSAAGMRVSDFFAGGRHGVIIPIGRSEAQYLRPLTVGDRILIRARPERLDAHRFAVNYEVVRTGPPEKAVARARTEHVCIHAKSRERVPLPAELSAWVDAG